MKRIVTIIFVFVTLTCLDCLAQYKPIAGQGQTQQSETYDPGLISRAQTIDYFLGIVPGAVQIRKNRWGWASGVLVGTVGFTTLTVCQTVRLNKAIVNADANPSDAVYYEGVMQKAKLWRNIGIIGLGITEIINYISAIRLEDKSDIGKIGLYTDPQGAIGLSYAFVF